MLAFRKDLARKVLHKHVELMFKAIRKRAEIILSAFDPILKDLGKKVVSASKGTPDSDYIEMLSDEISSIREHRNEMLPLILIMTYSLIESSVFSIARYVTKRTKYTGMQKWKRLEDDLANMGIILKNIDGFDHVNHIRLLVNSYKHANSVIDNAELSSYLNRPIGDRINWEDVDVATLVVKTETFANGIVSAI